MKMSSSERRTVMIASAAVFAALLAFRGLPMWLAWNAAVEVEARSLLEEARTTHATLSEAHLVLDTLRQRSERVVQLGAWLIAGDTPDAAASVLGAHVATVFEASGVEVSSMQVVADTTVLPDYATITARMRLRGTFHSLIAALAELESNRPMLSVVSLAVHRSDSGQSGVGDLEMDIAVCALAFSVEDTGSE